MVVATGSRPRIPDFAPVDGERVLTTRHCYPPPEIPEHMVVIGSGVTGVEFTHMFDSLGSKVTLLVSRQQVLPIKDAEVASVLEAAFLDRGIALLKGARASSIERDGATVRVSCEDGRVVEGSHVVQLDRRKNLLVDEAGVVERFGVGPASIPDYLALVGDSADGFPGIPGWGARSAATLSLCWNCSGLRLPGLEAWYCAT